MKYLVILLSLMLALPTFAGTTLIGRMDCSSNGQPFYTKALILPQGEFWLYGASQVEIGKLVSVATKKDSHCLAGGYLAWNNDTKKAFVEPFVIFSYDMGKYRSTVKPLCYIPLNNGGFSAGFDEISVTYQIADNVRFGPSATLWSENSETTFRYGFQLELNKDRTAVFARYLVKDGDSTVRLQLSQSF